MLLSLLDNIWLGVERQDRPKEKKKNQDYCSIFGCLIAYKLFIVFKSGGDLKVFFFSYYKLTFCLFWKKEVIIEASSCCEKGVCLAFSVILRYHCKKEKKIICSELDKRKDFFGITLKQILTIFISVFSEIIKSPWHPDQMTEKMPLLQNSSLFTWL